MTNNYKLDEIKKLVTDCVTNNNIDFLSHLIHTLQKNYIELAELATEGRYNEGWLHQQVLDCITYEV